MDDLFDEVIAAREALRNATVRTDCHDFEVGASPTYHEPRKHNAMAKWTMTHTLLYSPPSLLGLRGDVCPCRRGVPCGPARGSVT